ncbi:MAG: hypothetical protein KBT27_15765 [Prevotellaceae bacterium]|nr:hypothetical protein [Candidatus Faecinaster equi]
MKNSNLKLMPIILSLIIGFISALGVENDFIANNSITILTILLSLYVLLCTFMTNIVQRVHNALEKAKKKEQHVELAERAFSICEDEIKDALLKVGVCTLLLILQSTLLRYFNFVWIIVSVHTIVNAYVIRTYFHFYGWITNMFKVNTHIAKNNNDTK